MNKLHLIGKQSRIDELLKKISSDYGAMDFQNVIAMPESLNIEEGSLSKQAVAAFMSAINPDTPNVGYPKMTAENFKGLTERFKILLYNLKPEDLNQTNLDEELLKKGEVYVVNTLKYGAPTWYSWSIVNWGTKWNAIRAFADENNTVEFQTAWSPALPIVEKLSEMFPDLIMEFCWADEDVGCHVGKAKFENGKLTDYYELDNCTADAYRLSAEIWNTDLECFGLRYDEKVGNYVVFDEDEDITENSDSENQSIKI